MESSALLLLRPVYHDTTAGHVENRVPMKLYFFHCIHQIVANLLNQLFQTCHFDLVITVDHDQIQVHIGLDVALVLLLKPDHLETFVSPELVHNGIAHVRNHKLLLVEGGLPALEVVYELNLGVL